MALDNTPRALNVSPDGQELFFTVAGVDAVQVLDLATNQIVDQIPVGASPHLPSFTPWSSRRAQASWTWLGQRRTRASAPSR